jgi:alpha-L-glutamate ligase-like protein
MFFISPAKLREKGILGMNARNADCIAKYNKRALFPLADNKILTKKMALEAGIAVPELYFEVKGTFQLRGLKQSLAPFSDFVVKPCRGSGGEGVLVVAESETSLNRYTRASGEVINIETLSYHVRNILHGLYSLGGQPDCAMIEYRVKVDSAFSKIAVRGVPDIRVVTLLGVPVMAMLRLPTYSSSGRANLHQGAVGVGIELGSGTTTDGVQNGVPVEHHPDTKEKLKGCRIPFWHEILMIASLIQEKSGLGYLGVDIVLDDLRGPMILEINARPGLAVQIANGIGLYHRVKEVERLASKLSSVEERVRFAMESFG